MHTRWSGQSVYPNSLPLSMCLSTNPSSCERAKPPRVQVTHVWKTLDGSRRWQVPLLPVVQTQPAGGKTISVPMTKQ